MRILFCTNSLGARGGIERVTIIKANALADISGNEVVICYTDKGTYPESIIHPLSPKVKVYDLGVTFWDLHPLTLRRILITAPHKLMALHRSLRRVADEFHPDVIVTTGSYEKFALATMRFRHAVKIREYHFYSGYRDYIGASRLIRLAGWIDNRVLGRRFDCNFLLTNEDKERNFPGNNRYRYQHNPCSFGAEPTLQGNRENIVLAVGRLHPLKDFHSLLRIWQTVAPKAPGWQLWIAGTGEEKANLEKAVSELGISETTRMLGFRDDIDQLLSRCKIMALTSKSEGMPLNVIEAMHQGAAVVSYACPCGPRDIITDGVDGLLVDSGDTDRFAEALMTLIDNPDLLQRISEAGRRRAADFTPDTIAQSWMRHYREISEQKNNICFSKQR